MMDCGHGGVKTLRGHKKCSGAKVSVPSDDVYIRKSTRPFSSYTFNVRMSLSFIIIHFISFFVIILLLQKFVVHSHKIMSVSRSPRVSTF